MGSCNYLAGACLFSWPAGWLAAGRRIDVRVWKYIILHKRAQLSLWDRFFATCSLADGSKGHLFGFETRLKAFNIKLRLVCVRVI